MKIPSSLGKLLYGALFMIGLPAALLGWARGARINVSLPFVESVPWGAAVASAGLLLWSAGVVALRLKGGGFPMNAYPPPRLVSRGVYSVVAHPIYAGFILLCFGAAVGCGSSAGQWLVSPMLALAAGALWWGYERIDLRERFGAPPRVAWLGIPSISYDSPSLPQRIGSLIAALAAPSLTALMIHGAGLAGRPMYLLEEPHIRAWGTLAIVAASVYAAMNCIDLRDIVLSTWLGSLVLALLVLVFPSGPFGGRLPLAPDGALVTLVAMTGLASLLSRAHRLPRSARWVLALVGGLFLVGRGAWPSPESLLGAVAFAFANARWQIWRAALRFCERIGNCWSESDLGAVRIIHIGWFAALPAFGGVAWAAILVGPEGAAMAIWGLVFIIIGAALWAQIIEGSPALSRPYGFFGAVAGILVFALLVAPLAFDMSPWLVLATFSAAAPWAQGLARMRRLANGCCHGSPCGASCGIVYRNPRTRVVRLANLGGIPIHPAQLYSLAGNVIIGAFVMRLWAEGASCACITGIYFALMGLARFVEEAWRGEPQTPVFAGLRLYQWVSIGCFVGGAVLTVIPGTPRQSMPAPSLAALWAGLAAAALTWLVTSVDFPRSKRRFARLA